MSKQPVKQVGCKDCGGEVTVNAQATKPVRCYNCGLRAHEDQVRQMHLKSGPYYDAWLKTNGPTGRGKGRGTPPDQDTSDPLF